MLLNYRIFVEKYILGVCVFILEVSENVIKIEKSNNYVFDERILDGLLKVI